LHVTFGNQWEDVMFEIVDVLSGLNTS